MKDWFRKIFRRDEEEPEENKEAARKSTETPVVNRSAAAASPKIQQSREPSRRKSKEPASNQRSKEKAATPAKTNSTKTNKSTNKSTAAKVKLNNGSVKSKSVSKEQTKSIQQQKSKKEDTKSEAKSVVKSVASKENNEEEKEKGQRSTKSKEKSMSKEKTSKRSKMNELSKRAITKMKVFVSRPITEDGMKKTLEKVQFRKNHTAHSAMRDGDDAFPKRKENPKEQRKVQKPEDVFADNLPDTSKASKKLPSPNDKNNNSASEKPFWMLNKEDFSSEDTADDLALNADIIVDVHEQRVQLASMPSVPVVLDPFHKLEDMKKKDKLFFTKEVLFGNTVRTMININDYSVRSRDEDKQVKQLPFSEATSCHSYSRSNVGSSELSSFETKSKAKKKKK